MSDSIIINVKGNRRSALLPGMKYYWMSNSKILFRDGSSKLISGFLSLIRLSDIILPGGLEMRSDLKKDWRTKEYIFSGTDRESIILAGCNQYDYRPGK